MIHELDGAGPADMTSLFYQHGYEQLRMSLQNLLRILGRDPDA
jgi:hypothetical protein